MFLFDTTGAQTPASANTPRAALDFAFALAVARRSARMILATGLLGAIAAYVGTSLLTPKYVATAEIYVDPASAQGSTTEPIAPGEDSNGFVNYVETQKLIVTSRNVLERVVRAQGLDHEPEFVGSGGGLFGALFRSPASPGDLIAAAARSLQSHVQVARPERTFVLDISVSAANPERAAELANATAKAYVEEVAALRADAARQTSSAIAERLESLRVAVIKAEAAIEVYKSDHGLVGARDASTLEVQLRALQDQMAQSRVRESDAMARAAGAEAARKNPADLSVFAAQFGLMTLSQLRSQQAEARQKLADANADLGPRHPQAIQAEARVKAADDAVDAELVRFARAQRLELQRAKVEQADLQRQVDTVKQQTSGDDQAMVGLRDLDRKAQAARDVYQLFVQRSRDVGAIQDIAPTRTKVISVAAPPKARSFPPSGVLVAGAGFVAGLGIGFLLALFREGALPMFAPPVRQTPPARVVEPAPVALAPERPPAAEAAPAIEPALAEIPRLQTPQKFHLGFKAPLIARWRPQSLDALQLTGLGFPTLAAGADASEWLRILNALPDRADGPKIVAVTGGNEAGERTTLALNLALAAAREHRVALIDAAGRNARLTRAVRQAVRRAVLDGGIGYRTRDGVRLVLPKAGDARRGRVKPTDALQEFVASGRYGVIVLDGPDATEVDARQIFGEVSAILALEDEGAAEALAELGFMPDAVAVFAAPAAGERMSA